jgi:hypothetical protein
MNSFIHNNLSLFTKGLPTFTMVNLFDFIQNLVKHKVNLDTYWCSVGKAQIPPQETLSLSYRKFKALPKEPLAFPRESSKPP